MKRIITALLALTTVISMLTFFGCTKENQPTEEPTKTEGVVELLNGKTPYLACKEALEGIKDIKNFALTLTTKNVASYQDISQESTEEVYYTTDGSGTYYKTIRDNELENEVWYNDGYIYYSNQYVKEKEAMDPEYFDRYASLKPSSLIFDIGEKYLADTTFKVEDNLYIVSTSISAEDYRSLAGIESSEDAVCTITLNDKGEIVSFSTSSLYISSGGVAVSMSRELKFSKINTVTAIALPENIADFRTPVAQSDLDMTEIASLDLLEATEEQTDIVIIDVKDKGRIAIRLFPTLAPRSVENFKGLVARKFFDGSTFHRVINNFMIQGGISAKGESSSNIVGEFIQNGITNNLKHVRGVISMARADDMNSASSQFFIVHHTSAHLDGQYAGFGFVIFGMDVVDAIAAVETDENDKPLEDIVINTVTFAKLVG